MAKSYTVKIPGKLYLAGEYAILQAGQGAIILAVDRYLTCQIKKRQKPGFSLHSASLGEGAIDCQTSQALSQYPDWRYVQAAIELTHTYLQEVQIHTQPFDLRIESDLDSPSGKKYGLGSSGAVTVGVIASLLELHQVKIDPLLLYKLAVTALLQMGSGGSFGDIATVSHGGIIYYQAFDRPKVLQALKSGQAIKDFIHRPWPGLDIQALNFPQTLGFEVGWTQSPASTDNLIEKLTLATKKSPRAYENFLKKAKQCVEDLKAAFTLEDTANILQAYQSYRQLLQGLSTAYQLGIETPALRTLIERAQEIGWAAKSSGAGGGDCGIALGPKSSSLQAAIRQAWSQAGIEVLNLQIAPSLRKESANDH